MNSLYLSLPVLTDILVICLAFAIAAYGIGLLKRLTVSSVFSINMEVGPGENISFNRDFSLFDSKGKKKAKMDELFTLAEERRTFFQERFQRTIDEARAQQLKQVK